MTNARKLWSGNSNGDAASIAKSFKKLQSHLPLLRPKYNFALKVFKILILNITIL